jgi:hypothetical protein
VSNLSFVLVVAGLAFGGLTALIGFGGFLTAWFHRSIGTPLPLPTLHNAHERNLYLGVAAAGVLVWGVALLVSLRIAP